MKARAHIVVSGSVQGVFYRANAHAKATSLGLSGWVRNLANGNVEVVAEGEKEKVRRLVEWCTNGGPPAARVKHVSVDWQAPTGGEGGFSIR